MKYEIKNTTKSALVTINGLLRSNEPVVIAPQKSVVHHKNEFSDNAQQVLSAFADSVSVTEVTEVDQGAEKSVQSNKQEAAKEAAKVPEVSANEELKKQAEELANSASKEALIKAASDAKVETSGSKLEIATRLIQAGVTTIVG